MSKNKSTSLEGRIEDLEVQLETLEIVMRNNGLLPPLQEVEERVVAALGYAEPEETPAERRARGQKYCPKCYTFGEVHSKSCPYVRDGMTHHITQPLKKDNV